MRACRNCHFLTGENVCPVCKSQDFSDKWKGFVLILDPDRSAVAKQMGVNMPGKYALKLN